jgi:hypothetical protein
MASHSIMVRLGRAFHVFAAAGIVYVVDGPAKPGHDGVVVTDEAEGQRV